MIFQAISSYLVTWISIQKIYKNKNILFSKEFQVILLPGFFVLIYSRKRFEKIMRTNIIFQTI